MVSSCVSCPVMPGSRWPTRPARGERPRSDRSSRARLSGAMATDEGFFGPSSVSWRIHRDASAILGAGRALLVQALEPHVMDVFLKNTDYRDDPWGRLRRTGDYFGDVIFGDTARAVAAGGEEGRLPPRPGGGR